MVHETTGIEGVSMLDEKLNYHLQHFANRRKTLELRLQPSDMSAFGAMVSIEKMMLDGDLIGRVAASHVRRQRYSDAVRRYHAALPFTSGELGLLGDLGLDSHAFLYKGEQTTVMDAGICEVIHGGQLLDKWLRWRAREEPYAKPNARALACTALGDVVRLVTTAVREP